LLTHAEDPLYTSPPEGIGEGEIPVRKRPSNELNNTNIADLLSQGPQNDQSCDFTSEQCKEPDVVKIINYLEDSQYNIIIIVLCRPQEQ